MEGIIEDLKKLVERGVILEVDGEKYSPVKLHKVVDDRIPPAIKIGNLRGLVDYVSNKVDACDTLNLFVVVDSYKEVSLCEFMNQETMVRKEYLSARLEEVKDFPFGSFLEQEDFLIKIRSMFKPNTDRDRLLAFASRISTDDSLKTQDDGISQAVTVSRGVSGALKQLEIAPLVLSLAPYRTFREVEQPASDFIFRLRGGRGELPQCALFEADGGAWKLEANKNVSDWLKDNLSGMIVLS